MVNTAARAQSAADAGAILVTRAVRDGTAELTDSPYRPYALKGYAEPVELFAA